MIRSIGSEGFSRRLHQALVIGLGAVVALVIAFWNLGSVLDKELYAFSKPTFAMTRSTMEFKPPAEDSPSAD